MRLTLLFPLFLLAAGAATHAQDLSGQWTNGWMEFSGGKVNDSLWVFDGGNLHEGGYRFAMKPLTDSSWLLKGFDRDGKPDDRAGPIVGRKEDRIIYRMVDGHRALIFQSAVGAVDDIMVPLEKSQQLDDVVTGNKIAYQLGGEYVDTRNWKPVVFYPGRPEVQGLMEGSGVYYFSKPYDIPENVLYFGNKTSFYYERTDSTLELYSAVGIGDEEHRKGRNYGSCETRSTPGMDIYLNLRNCRPISLCSPGISLSKGQVRGSSASWRSSIRGSLRKQG